MKSMSLSKFERVYLRSDNEVYGAKRRGLGSKILLVTVALLLWFGVAVASLLLG